MYLFEIKMTIKSYKYIRGVLFKNNDLYEVYIIQN